MIKFEWDPNKNIINIKKHRVDFNEALSVFFDENALVIDDVSHSDSEDRFVIIGQSMNLNILVVCHCYRDEEETIRIISSRKATKKEIRDYKGDC